MAEINGGRPSDQVNHFEESNLQLNFLNLPCEIQLHIFSFLTHEELRKSAALVCHEWRRLSEDPSLWKSVTILIDRLEEKPKFVRLLKRCTTLRRLRIKTSNGTRSLDEELAVASSAFPMLKYLDLSNTSICKNVLGMFAKNCPLIEELNLENCGPCECPTDVFTIAHLKHLRVLNLAESYDICSLLDDDGILLISEKCTHLEDLNIYESLFEVTDNAISKMIENLHPKLRRLVLGGECLNWSDLAFAKIGLCTKLQDLSIELFNGELLTDKMLAYLQMLTNLKSLNLKLFSHSLTTFGANSFFVGPHVHNLVNLELVICIDDDGVYNITQNCKLLKSLTLELCSALTEVGFEHIVRHCSNLTRLDLSSMDLLTGFCLQLMPEKLSSLEFLYLFDVTEIAASILNDLAIRMPNLEIVSDLVVK